MGTKELLNIYGDKAELLHLSEEQNKTLKKTLLSICDDIFSFCEEYDLCCMLGGGSALGAVRHKGFIPWDDDVDLNMPREDYEKFAALFTLKMGDKYDIFVPDGKHGVTNLFMKVSKSGTRLEDVFIASSKTKYGISVDIFPIENVPQKAFARKMKGLLSNGFAYLAVSNYIFENRGPLMKSLYCGSVKGKINYCFRCVAGAMLSWRPYEWWYCKYDRLVQCKEKSRYCTIPTGRRHYGGEMCEWTEFLPVKKTAFEDRIYNIPNNTDGYLTRLYGNYMEVPPIEKREKHFYTAVDFGGE